MAAASPFVRKASVKDWAASKSVDVPGAPNFARSAEQKVTREALDDEDRGGPPVPKFRKGQGVVVAIPVVAMGMTWAKGTKGTVVNMVDTSVRRPKQRFNVRMPNGDLIPIQETKLDEA